MPYHDNMQIHLLRESPPSVRIFPDDILTKLMDENRLKQQPRLKNKHNNILSESTPLELSSPPSFSPSSETLMLGFYGSTLVRGHPRETERSRGFSSQEHGRGLKSRDGRHSF